MLVSISVSEIKREICLPFFSKCCFFLEIARAAHINQRINLPRVTKHFCSLSGTAQPELSRVIGFFSLTSVFFFFWTSHARNV